MFLALKERLFGSKNGASKCLARSRLHFVLVQDRTGLTSDEMARFKSEMVGVIEKFFVIDRAGFDISYKRDSETTTLLINSPVLIRRRDDVVEPEKIEDGGRVSKVSELASEVSVSRIDGDVGIVSTQTAVLPELEGETKEVSSPLVAQT